MEAPSYFDDDIMTFRPGFVNLTRKINTAKIGIPTRREVLEYFIDNI